MVRRHKGWYPKVRYKMVDLAKKKKKNLPPCRSSEKGGNEQAFQCSKNQLKQSTGSQAGLQEGGRRRLKTVERKWSLEKFGDSGVGR